MFCLFHKFLPQLRFGSLARGLTDRLSLSLLNTACSFDITNAGGNYDQALSAFTACAEAAQPDGYCHAKIMSAAFLRNQDVCAGGSSSNIGFHIQIPMVVHEAGTYHFRLHAVSGQRRPPPLRFVCVSEDEAILFESRF